MEKNYNFIDISKFKYVYYLKTIDAAPTLNRVGLKCQKEVFDKFEYKLEYYFIIDYHLFYGELKYLKDEVRKYYDDGYRIVLKSEIDPKTYTGQKSKKKEMLILLE